MADSKRRRPPTGLAARGRRLWREVTDGPDLGPAQIVLLEEACRMADRLDQLDRILAGDVRELVEVVIDELPGGAMNLRLVVNAPLSEARQQATALRGIVAELRRTTAAPSTGRQDSEEGTPTGVVDLAARIAARGNNPKG